MYITDKNVLIITVTNLKADIEQATMFADYSHKDERYKTG